MGTYDWEEFHNYGSEYEDAMQEPALQSIECTCIVERVTEKAYLLHIKELDKSGWFPKSQVKVVAEGKYDIPLWLLKKLKE